MRILAVSLALAATLAGCVGPSGTLESSSLDGALEDATKFDTSRGWSIPLSPEVYETLAPVRAIVPSFDETPIALGIFLPEIPGCDFSDPAGEAAPLPDAC